jgi:hypothetical protein
VDTPAGVTAQALSTSEIRLSWNAVTTGAERYYLYTAANSSGPWTELAYVSATFSYTHSGLSAGTAYYYKVRAYRNGIYSADSTVVSAIPPTSGLFGRNEGLISGVDSPFSIANALLRLKTNGTYTALGTYTIVIDADETLAPQTLAREIIGNGTTDGYSVSITLKGYGSERTVQLASAGSLFTVNSQQVSLTLGENITLKGLASNTASLVRVIGGRLVMEERAKVMGNINNSTTYRGGGVYVSSGTFKKQPASGSSTSGVIYGYTADDAKSNKVVNSSGVVQSGCGHAVLTSVNSRETTVVETESLDSTVAGAAGGWVE